MRDMIISLLKLSKQGPVSHELLKNECKLPSQIMERLMKSLQDDGLIYLHDGFIETNKVQRLKLAVRALGLGADFERVSSFLDWKEFESAAAFAFQANEYEVMANLRFKHAGRRWEIDIVGCRRPIVICADCKHWRHGFHPSTIGKIIQEQVTRTLAFSESLPSARIKMKVASWSRARFVPLVLSLTPTRLKLNDGTPVVPIFQLHDFLIQLPMNVDSFRHFDKTFSLFKIA